MKIQLYVFTLVFISICITISLSRTTLLKEVTYGLYYVGGQILMMVYFWS